MRKLKMVLGLMALVCGQAVAQSEGVAPIAVQKLWTAKIKGDELYGLPDERWHPLFMNQEMFVMLDKNTVDKSVAPTYTVWLRKYLTRPIAVGSQKGDHIMTREILDCASHRSRTLTTTMYDRRGRKIYSDPVDATEDVLSAWSSWQPGTTGEQVYTYACEDLPALIPTTKH